MYKSIFTALAISIGAGASYADEPWTLTQCIDYAMANNLDIKLKQVSIDLADVDIEANKGALFPSLSASTNQNGSWRPWSESYTNITDGSLSSTHSTVNYNGTYGLQAQWTVWNGGINRKQLQRSRLSKEQAVIDEQTTMLDLQERIAQIYVQILYQKEALGVNKQILESTHALLDRAQQMYEVGTMSRADLAQMQAQLSQEEYNCANAATTLANYRLQLAQLLEIKDDEGFDVASPSLNDEAIMAMLPAKEEVFDLALDMRPEIAYSKLGVEAADMDISIAKKGYLPTVSLSAGVNTNTSSGMMNSWGEQIKRNLSNSIGLTVSVPIFDNKRNSTNVSKARLNKLNAEINLERERKDLYNEISTIWLDAFNAQQQYSYAKINAESMRESYDLVSEQFGLGLKDIVDLTTGKNNLIQAEQQLLQARYTAALNLALLHFYQGKSLSF
ncbi:MAG: TolC family protein [Clostridium sp.]|nr:TolC family protein [Clostridium sp.]